MSGTRATAGCPAALFSQSLTRSVLEASPLSVNRARGGGTSQGNFANRTGRGADFALTVIGSQPLPHPRYPRSVLVTGFPAGSFAANCYLVAPGPGEECVIIDPGEDAEQGIDELLRKYRLKPVAVLLSHGHIDHIWSVAPVCGANDVPAYIHPDDRELLSDPARGFSLGPGQQLFGGLKLSEPDDVRELTDGLTLPIAGLEFTVDHAPGHTPGSVTFRLPGGAPGEVSVAPRHDARSDPGLLFSGDLLFAGSIGRTDLPGGDYQTMMVSLTRVCLPLPADTVVLPGHGPDTTIGAERASNPFLVPLVRRGAGNPSGAPGAAGSARPHDPGHAGENARARRL